MTQAVTDKPAEHLVALRAELAHLDGREPEANAALDRIAQEWPAAQAAVDLARAGADPNALPAAEDALRRLSLEKANAESVLRGVAIRRESIRWDLHVAEAKVARGEARALLPDEGAGATAEEAGEEFFGRLAHLVAGIKAAVDALPRDDQRAARDTADLPQLARWVWTRCAQAGLPLDGSDRFHGSGVGPAETLANLTSLTETLT